MTALFYLAAAALGVARVAGVKSVLFQGFAHVFVGGLGGAWATGRGRTPGLLFVALCVVEALCFAASRSAPN